MLSLVSLWAVASFWCAVENLVMLARHSWIPSKRVLSALDWISLVLAVSLIVHPHFAICVALVILSLFRVSLWGGLIQGGADVVMFWAGVAVSVGLWAPGWAEKADHSFALLFSLGYIVAGISKLKSSGRSVPQLLKLAPYPIPDWVGRIPDSLLIRGGILLPWLQIVAGVGLLVGPPFGFFALGFWLLFHLMVAHIMGLQRFLIGFGLVLWVWLERWTGA
jgi:hypothetical protein